ncbi:MAG: hypothetical protein DRJ03_22065 [Chloroflexi bacterium]|nr:MAG: hypothetical protein DRJ03_22065 [Chloroflexota bacterium]
MIRITFLGTRGLVEEQNEAHKHHTAYIIEDGKQRVLFDFGETWAQEPLPNVDAIWISHAHPDHIGGLDGRVVDIPIFCSAVTKSLLPKGLKANDVHIIEHKKEFDLLKWRALPFPVTHSIIAPATGLRLVVDGQVIVLPSDVLYFESADDLMKDAILYIADGSTLEKSLVRKHKETGELFGHAALRQQLRWCQKYGVPLLFAIHYGKEPIGMTDPVLARWLQQTQEAVAPDASAHIAWDGKVVEIEGNRVRWRRKRGEWVEETLTQSRVSVPLVRPPFKYPVGKARLAPRLVDLLPEHKRYVEPFCGAAAVFFAKEPSEEEILADIDPDVIFALKWMRNATEKDIREFSRLELVGTRADFERIKNRKPRTPTERAHKVIYLLRFSWAANRISFSAPDGGRDLKAFVRDLPRWRQRLKDAHLLVQDWRKTLDEFDSTGTLFYLDPPYEDTKNVGDAPTAEELADRLRRLKGKFLLTWRGDIKPFKESGFQIRKVVHHSNPNFADVVWTEYIIANYDLPRKRFEVRYSQDTPKKIEIPEIRVSLLPRGIPAKAQGVADAFGIAEHPEHTLVKPATVRIESGDRVLIVGHSGSGKSLLLARLVKELKAATPQFEENKPCVDHFKDLDFNEALAIFARCGLSDVYFMLRTPAELSDGQ